MNHSISIKRKRVGQALSVTSQFKISELEKPVAWRSLLLYLQTYLAIIAAVYVGITVVNPIITLLVILFIAGRQHSLYILNHDASHYSLFRNSLTNQIVATLFSNLVMFHHPEAWSFIQWRRVHLKHHNYLFTQDDPNYIGRKKAGDTQRIYSRMQLLWACIVAIPQTIQFFFLGKQDYVEPKTYQFTKSSLLHIVALIVPFRDDLQMEIERAIKLCFFALIFTAINYFSVWKPFILFWIIPMYSFYPMILKFHDLAEHYWHKPSTDIEINTRTSKRSTLVKIALSSLPREYHKEHHLFPRVCVVNLPKLHALINMIDSSILDDGVGTA